MRTTLHLDEAYQSPRTGKWNMRLIERMTFRCGFLWLWKDFRDVPLHVVGYMNEWFLVEHGFQVDHRSPINQFCNYVVTRHVEEAMKKEPY